MMSPAVRKLALTVHVSVSVGWLGAVAGFLALAINALWGGDQAIARMAYPSMALMTWYVIVPLCLASLVSGVVQSLGTPWGLFRHYWVVGKLLITVVATILLAAHVGPISALGNAIDSISSGNDLHPLRVRMIVDALGALVALLAATALAIYKPRGVTSYGRRAGARGAESPAPHVAPGAP